jgi:hypothetical protein
VQASEVIEIEETDSRKDVFVEKKENEEEKVYSDSRILPAWVWWAAAIIIIGLIVVKLI